jgi:site-specific DNA-adenine methylase
MMQPFFSYYGGKWKLAERLGPPQRDHVIEPFAGSSVLDTNYNGLVFHGSQVFFPRTSGCTI